MLSGGTPFHPRLQLLLPTDPTIFIVPGGRPIRDCRENGHPNEVCHPDPELREGEGSAVAFSCFRVEHHSIPDCGCSSMNY